MTSAPQTADRESHAATALCLALPLTLYLSTLARTVQGGDSGELALIGVVGGVAHPPGYPLYSLLARAGALLPLGLPFWRVALVSAICGAAAVAVIQRVALRFTSDVVASVAAALVFAVSPVQWRLSGIPEVFTLHGLLAAWVVLQSLRCAEGSRRAWDLPLLGLACGLGLSNHLTIIWCTPLPVMALAQRFRGQPMAVVGAGGAQFVLGLLIGLLPYATLPYFASHAAPAAMVWGHAETLRGFVTHVLRREYGTFQLTTSSDTALFHVAPVVSYLSSLPRQLGYVAFALSIPGIVMAFRRRTPGTAALLVSWLLAGVLFTSRFNLPLSRELAAVIEERFHLLPTLLLVPFVAVGIDWATRRLALVSRIAAAAGLIAVLALVTRPRVDWSRETTIERYATAAVQWTKPDAVLVGSSDTWFSAIPWVTRVLGVRPDVRYVDLNIARFPWYADLLGRDMPRFPPGASDRAPWQLALALASRDHPTYILAWDSLEPERGRIATDPEGLVDRIVRPGSPARPLADVEADLVRATDALGRQPAPPVDMHCELVRHDAQVRWLELAKRFEAAGDPEGVRRCRERAKALSPAG
jgi:hypothetical protein